MFGNGREMRHPIQYHAIKVRKSDQLTSLAPGGSVWEERRCDERTRAVLHGIRARSAAVKRDQGLKLGYTLGSLSGEDATTGL